MSSSDAHSVSSRFAGISTLTPLRASAASRAASAGLSLTSRGSCRAAADWLASVNAPGTATMAASTPSDRSLELDEWNTAEC